jgi:hypothetical protein
VPFSPSDLSGLAVWLDASQLGLADGATIDTWPSLANPTLVGTNFNVAPYRPTLRAAGLNGMPVARFIGGSGLRWSGIGIDLDYTLVYVGRMWGTAPGRIVSASYQPANVAVGYHGGYEDKTYVEGWLLPDVSKPQTMNWHLYSLDGGGVAPDYKPRFFSDGVFLSGDHGTNGGWKGSFQLNGYSPSSGEETCDCEVAEVVMYDRKLSDVERQSVEAYLQQKWFAVAPPPEFPRRIMVAL